MFAQHVGGGGRGGSVNDTYQEAVTECNDILQKEIRCYSFKRKGHYSDQSQN